MFQKVLAAFMSFNLHFYPWYPGMDWMILMKDPDVLMKKGHRNIWFQIAFTRCNFSMKFIQLHLKGELLRFMQMFMSQRTAVKLQGKPALSPTSGLLSNKIVFYFSVPYVIWKGQKFLTLYAVARSQMGLCLQQGMLEGLCKRPKVLNNAEGEKHFKQK